MGEDDTCAITQNVQDIISNSAGIESNSASIETNSVSIQSNSANIASLQSTATTMDNEIDENRDDIEMLMTKLDIGVTYGGIREVKVRFGNDGCSHCHLVIRIINPGGDSCGYFSTDGNSYV